MTSRLVALAWMAGFLSACGSSGDGSASAGKGDRDGSVQSGGGSSHGGAASGGGSSGGSGGAASGAGGSRNGSGGVAALDGGKPTLDGSSSTMDGAAAGPSSCPVSGACDVARCTSGACFDENGCATSSTKYWGAEWHDYGEQVLVTTENDRVLVGYTNLTNDVGGNSDLFLAKLAPDGKERWSVRWGSPAVDYMRRGALDASGNVYVVGDTQGNLDNEQNAGGRDIFVTKFTAAGTPVWTTLLGSAADDAPYDVAVNAAGDRIVVVGLWAFDAVALTTRAFVARLDSSGAVVQNVQLDSWGVARAETVAMDAAGRVFVSGAVDAVIPGQSSAGKRDAFAAELSADLKVVWATQWGSSDYDWTNGSALDSAGNFYVTGTTQGAIGGNPAPKGGDWTAYVSRLTAGGKVSFTHVYNHGKDTRGGDIVVTRSGDLFLAGTVLGELVPTANSDGADVFWMRLCADGAEKAVQQWGLGDDDWAWSVAEDTGGHALVAGYARRTPDLGGGTRVNDAFVIDVAPE